MANEYCSTEELDLLKECIKAGANLVFYGETASFKENFSEFFSEVVPADREVIWIKDTQEWHKNPRWILLTKTRLHQAVYVTDCFNNKDENSIYRFVDGEVLLESRPIKDENGRESLQHYIAQIRFYNQSPGGSFYDKKMAIG